MAGKIMRGEQGADFVRRYLHLAVVFWSVLRISGAENYLHDQHGKKAYSKILQRCFQPPLYPLHAVTPVRGVQNFYGFDHVLSDQRTSSHCAPQPDRPLALFHHQSAV